MPPTMTIAFLMIWKIGLAIFIFSIWMGWGLMPLLGGSWDLPGLGEKHIALDFMVFVFLTVVGYYLTYQIAERIDNVLDRMRNNLHPNNIFYLKKDED